MIQEKLKCDYEDCEDEAANHATHQVNFPDGYVFITRTYHSNLCPNHLREKQNEFPFTKVFELGKCEDEDCNSGKLPPTSEIQK